LQIQRLDVPLAITIFAMTIFGWMMVSSLSGPASYGIFMRNDVNCFDPDVNCNSLFMWKHFWHMIAGFCIGGFSIYFPYRYWKKIAFLLLITICLLLITVVFSSFGTAFGTIAQSWINIPFLPAFQPSEFVKIILILYLSHWMSRRSDQIRSFKEGLIPFAILTSLVVVPVIMQPDYGSALIISIIAASIFFLAGAKISHLLLGATVVVILSAGVILSNDVVRDRFYARFQPTENCEIDKCFQTYQSLIAIGSGGFTGVGYNSSRQKHNWLPEVETDFIFAGISEELGFIRVIFLVFGYLFIGYRGYIISKNAPDKFGRLVAFGITISIVGQAFINIAINLDLMPVTGITLPLISHGGSSLLTSLWGLGILLNISQNVRPETTNLSHRRRVRRAHYAKPRYY